MKAIHTFYLFYILSILGYSQSFGQTSTSIESALDKKQGTSATTIPIHIDITNTQTPTSLTPPSKDKKAYIYNPLQFCGVNFADKTDGQLQRLCQMNMDFLAKNVSKKINSTNETSGAVKYEHDLGICKLKYNLYIVNKKISNFPPSNSISTPAKETSSFVELTNKEENKNDILYLPYHDFFETLSNECNDVFINNYFKPHQSVVKEGNHSNITNNFSFQKILGDWLKVDQTQAVNTIEKAQPAISDGSQ